MNKYTELLIGIILLVVGVWGIYYFSIYAPHAAVKIAESGPNAGKVVISPVLVLLESTWGFVVALVGLVFLILGISDMRS